MENHFEADHKLKQAYYDYLRKYEGLDHSIRLCWDEVNPDRNCFYLPHHGVWKNESTHTKLRTVFNGSNLIPNLADIVSYWCDYEFVFVGDIMRKFWCMKMCSAILHQGNHMALCCI